MFRRVSAEPKPTEGNSDPADGTIVIQVDPQGYCDWKTDPTCKPNFNDCIGSIEGPPYDIDSVDLCYVLYAPCEY